MINTEQAGPDLWLDTRDLDLRPFDLGRPFLSLSLSFSPLCNSYLGGYFHFTPRSTLERDRFLSLFFLI
jgi:hypothetical protein